MPFSKMFFDFNGPNDLESYNFGHLKSNSNVRQNSNLQSFKPPLLPLHGSIVSVNSSLKAQCRARALCNEHKINNHS